MLAHAIHKFGLFCQKIHACALCGVRAPIDHPHHYLCDACDQTITWLNAPFVPNLPNAPNIYPACAHTGAMASAMGEFKYQEDFTAMALIVHAMQKWQIPQDDTLVLIPMPTTHARLAQRGFDPVACLAPFVAQTLGAYLWAGAWRVRDGQRQQGLDREARLDNMAGAFECAPWQVDGDISFVLFDDVCTTGASLVALNDAVRLANRRAKIIAACITHGD